MKNICGENICRLCASEVTNSVNVFDGDGENGDDQQKKLSTVGEMMLDCLFSDVSIHKFNMFSATTNCPMF